MKAHLLTSADPLPQEAHDYTVICGESLANLSVVFVWDEQEIGGEPLLSPVYFCRKCIMGARADHTAQNSRRYLYGVIKRKSNE